MYLLHRSDKYRHGLIASEALISQYTAAILFEVFLYGIYITLFLICLYFLFKNKRPSQWGLLLAATLMFGLATADIIITLRFFFGSVLHLQDVTFDTLYPTFLLFLISNIVENSLLLFRCYTVWSHRKRIIALPCILLVASAVCGYLFEGSKSPSLRQHVRVYLWMTLTLNTSVTLLTAGRIWWIARRVRSIMGDASARNYYCIIGVVIESGALYSIYIVLDLALSSTVLGAGLVQLVGIAPTLIIVQIALGYETQDVDTIVIMLQAEAGREGSPVLDTVFSNTDSPTRTSCIVPPANNSQHHTSQPGDGEMQQGPEEMEIHLPGDTARFGRPID